MPEALLALTDPASRDSVRALRVHPLALIAGAAALATEIVTARLLAPFYGLGPYLQLVLLTVTLGSLAIGFVIGARPAGDERRAMAMAIGISGVWWLIATALRRPLLVGLERLGLKADVVIAAVMLTGPCLVLLGTIVTRAVRLGSARGEEAGGIAAQVLSTFAIGALLGGLIANYLAPAGAQRVGWALGLIEVAACLFFMGGGWRGKAAVAGMALLVATPQVVSARRAPRPGEAVPSMVVASRHGEFRVLDHEGSRYLLEDGTIQNVVEPATMTGLRRPEAALGLVRLLIPTTGRILIAGLRGGTLARSFQQAAWTVDVVDPEPAAVTVARSGFRLLPGEARTLTGEPRDVLRRTDQNYDAIVIDVLGDGFVAPELVTREFMALAERHLFQGGVLALVVDAQGWDDAGVRAIVATANAEFDTALALPTGEPPNTLGSVIVLAADRSLELDDAALPEPVEKLGDPLEHFNVLQINHAWENRYTPDGGAVLTDDACPVDGWTERINRASRQELHRFFGANGGSW